MFVTGFTDSVIIVCCTVWQPMAVWFSIIICCNRFVLNCLPFWEIGCEPSAFSSDLYGVIFCCDKCVWNRYQFQPLCINYPLQTESDLATLSLHEPSPEEKDEAERLKNKGEWRRMDFSHFASLFKTLSILVLPTSTYLFIKKVTEVVRKMRQSCAIFHIIFGVKWKLE